MTLEISGEYVLAAHVANEPKFTFEQDALLKKFQERYGTLPLCKVLCLLVIGSSALALTPNPSLPSAIMRLFQHWACFIPLVTAVSSLLVMRSACKVAEGNWLEDVQTLLLSSLPLYTLHEFEEHFVDRSAFKAFLNGRVAKFTGSLDQSALPADDIYMFIVNGYGIWLFFPLLAWLAGMKEDMGKTNGKERAEWYPMIMLGISGNVAIPGVNSIVHVLSAINLKAYNPGLVTAITVLLPYALFTVRRLNAAGLVDKKSVLAALVLGLLTHVAIFVPLIFQAKGVLTSVGVRWSVLLSLPLLVLVSAAIPPRKRHKSYSLSSALHQLFWYMGLAKLSPRLLKTGEAIFTNVKVGYRMIIPPYHDFSKMFANVGVNYRAMLETSGKPVFIQMMKICAEKVITSCSLKSSEITHLVVASDSTQHFENALPNIAIDLVDRLGLPRDINQFHLSLMGCCGGLQAMRFCLDAVKGQRGARALLVNFEATGTQSAVRQRVLDHHDLLQLGLFGDGTTAALLASDPLTAHEKNMNKLKKVECQSIVLPETKELLSHANHLDHVYSVVEVDVPDAIRSKVPPLVRALLDKHQIDHRQVAFLVHPGGPKILEKMQEAFELSEAQLKHSWDALYNHGNMSGATNIAVLHYFLHSENFDKFTWALAIAFGPGICMQAILFQVLGAEAPEQNQHECSGFALLAD